MTFSEAIKSGFSLINKRWQLVVVQVVTMLINCLAVFILVGIPVVIAFIALGMDIAGLTDTKDILGQFSNPSELFTKYLGLVLIVISSILIYILVATTIWLYVLGGSAGFIGRSILDPSLKFSMRAFFSEAGKIFFPLIWFFLLIGLVYIAVTIIICLIAAGIAAIVTIAKTQDSTLALFLGIFFSMIGVLVSLSIILFTLALTMYGIAGIFFKGEGSFNSLKGALKFIWNKHYAFWLYVLLLAGYFIVSFILMLITYPLNMIPIVGAIISLPIQVMTYAVQSYLGLVIIAVIFIYYFDSEVKKEVAVPETVEEVSAEGSTGVKYISDPQDHVQEETPPERDEKEQA